ncbi:MAG: histidine kinase [Lachnospiraceae bacterium]|nr:histidine kinase [Candidatus Minthocola equi]
MIMTKEKSGAKAQNFFTRHHKKVYISVIIAMSLLICWCIKSSTEFWVLRNVYAAVNTCIDIVMMVFLTMLFGFSVSAKYVGNKQNLFFSLLIAVDFAMLFFSTLGYTAYGLVEKADFIRITGSISYMLCYISFAVLWKYQMFFYEKTKVVKVSSYIINLSVLLYTALSVINFFTPVLFRIDANGYYDMGYPDYITVVVGVLLIVTLYINVLLSDCSLKQKIALVSYEIAPAIMIIIDIVSGLSGLDIYLPAIADVAMLFPLYIIFYYIYLEQKDEIARKELEQMQMETSLRISQIQPHFMYNCLSSIAVLCEEEPSLAGKATTTFADYLRENMSYIGSEKPIPFADEMRHVEGYVWLEKLRFSDRVNVVYDLGCMDFDLPALTVQPLVENAIKHGICKGTDSGTVTITSREDDESYIVTISDDGVGFDPSVSLNDGRQHVGIESVRKRLHSMVGGRMKVETAPGKGTNITITIPKKRGTL